MNRHTYGRADTNSGGRFDHIRAFVPRPEEHFALPEEISKAQAITTIATALRLMGASEREIAVFRHIADITRRDAWHAGDAAPVNWRRQCDMARELGLGERHFRRIEARLAGYGVLARATADNGYRGRRAGQSYRAPVQCGLSLEPALANFAGFAALCAEAEEAEAERQETILHIRAAKRRLALLIREIGDTETRRWAEEAFEAARALCPPGMLRGASATELDARHETLLDLEDRVRAVLAPVASAPDSAAASSEAPESASVENMEKQDHTSAAPDSQVRCHIQPESNQNEECNARKLAKIGNDPGLEEEKSRPPCPVSPEFLARLTPETLRNIASEDAALYLDVTGDWQEALPMLLRELGINISAWLDAADVMGEEIAFLAVLVIDRNRFHPTTPILNPGGALRAFTARARKGELNLTRAVLGIWERERQGRQPKAAPGPRKLQ